MNCAELGVDYHPLNDCDYRRHPPQSCDGIFCSKCGNNENNTGDAMMIQGKVVQSFERLDCDHKSTTVVPLSIAIKRMSQIMFYKAQHCVSRLEQGEEEIANELRQLEHRADETAVGIKNRFARLREELDERQRLLEEEVYEIKEQKKMVLEEQLEILRNEKERVEKVRVLCRKSWESSFNIDERRAYNRMRCRPSPIY